MRRDGRWHALSRQPFILLHVHDLCQLLVVFLRKKESTFASMAFSEQRNRSGYDFDCQCQNKASKSVSRFRATPASPCSQASCSQLHHDFFGFGERRNVGVMQGLPVDLVLVHAAKR